MSSALVNKYFWIYFCKSQSFDDIEVYCVVLNAERVIKTLQLWYALLQWHLTTFKASLHGVTGILTLGTATCSLSTFTADTTTDALWLLR